VIDKRSPFWIDAKYSGNCSECEAEIEVGERIVFDIESRQVYCGGCGEEIAGEDKKGMR
jgi:hypothetical protein